MGELKATLAAGPVGILASWLGGTRGGLQTGITRLSRTLTLISLKIPSAWGVGSGGRIPQTCGPLGAPCFLSGHMVA